MGEVRKRGSKYDSSISHLTAWAMVVSSRREILKGDCVCESERASVQLLGLSFSSFWDKLGCPMGSENAHLEPGRGEALAWRQGFGGCQDTNVCGAVKMDELPGKCVVGKQEGRGPLAPVPSSLLHSPSPSFFRLHKQTQARSFLSLRSLVASKQVSRLWPSSRKAQSLNLSPGCYFLLSDVSPPELPRGTTDLHAKRKERKDPQTTLPSPPNQATITKPTNKTTARALRKETVPLAKWVTCCAAVSLGVKRAPRMFCFALAVSLSVCSTDDMESWKETMSLALCQPRPHLDEHMHHWEWVTRPACTYEHTLPCGTWALMAPLCNYLLFWCEMVRIFSSISVNTAGKITLSPSPVQRLSQELIPEPERTHRECPRCGCRLPTALRFPFSVLHLCPCSFCPPPSFRCSVKPLPWPFSAVRGHLLRTFLAGSYPTSFPDQSSLCCSNWGYDSWLCLDAWW